MADAPGASKAAPSVSARADGGACVNVPVISQSQVGRDIHVNNYITGVRSEPRKELQQCTTDLQSFLRKQSKFLNPPSEAELSKIYTDLMITVEEREGSLETHHEMFSFECQRFGGVKIELKDLLRPSPGEQEAPQKVLMKGIAGMGKSVAVQKFTHDWASGRTNQNLQLLFPFSFRELNHLAEKKVSLKGLIDRFFDQVKDLRPADYEAAEVLFVFDGLDESRFPLNWRDEEVCSCMEQKTTIGVIISNLLTGRLLHQAKVWITSRPTATAHLPGQMFDRVTQLLGFSDDQISEFFRKTVQDEALTTKILDHLRSKYLPNLIIMCRIPLFSWLSATSLKDLLLKGSGDSELPKTMTQMYIHFLILLVQKNKTSGPETDREFVMNLGKLAYRQLESNHVIFYREDLIECGLDLDDEGQVSVVAGFCNQIIRKDCGIHKTETYSFIHLTVQEFLAALFVLSSDINPLPNQHKTKKQEILLVHQHAMEMALDSPNGHWDLFLRFLFGLSERQNQSLLERVLGKGQGFAVDKTKTIKYITDKIKLKTDRNRTINLFYCLSELGDTSLVNQVQRLFSSGKVSEISSTHWSALAFLILVSGEDLDTFQLSKYCRSDDTLERLQPVLNAARTAELSKCNLSSRACKCVSVVLGMTNSKLEEVNLSKNQLKNIGVKILCEGLRSQCCRLKTLRLEDCELTEDDCEPLSYALKCPSLTELDLSYNQLLDSGVHQLLRGLGGSDMKEKKNLRLVSCGITAHSCESLASTLRGNLRKLDLSHNDLGDRGVSLLCEGLREPRCQLETLRLSGCGLSEACCPSLSSLLESSSQSLTHLDLSDNDLQDVGVHSLTSGLKSQFGQLESLRLSGCMISEHGCRSLASVVESNLRSLKELDLSYNHPGHVSVTLPAAGPNDPGVRTEHCGQHRIRPGPRKYWCLVSLDVDTAKKNIQLSSDKLKASSHRNQESYRAHEKRFKHWFQVLGQEELTGQRYWEVKWKGEVEVAVTHAGIKRSGDKLDSRLGRNSVSWCLRCGEHGEPVGVFHDNKETLIDNRSTSTHVAVHLDLDAGRLTYFGVSQDTLTPLHTFNCAFTKHVLPGFWLSSKGAAVSLVPHPQNSRS